jgi:hypothetical protein
VNLHESLVAQIARIEELRELPFDNASYDEWRSETGRILDQVFGNLDSEQHPCAQAFLSYRIPKDFTASRDEMQEFYSNILKYQRALLQLYLEDT